MAQIGLESERLEMINVSSAMGGQFAEAARQMVERVGALRPNPLRADGVPATAPDPDGSMRGRPEETNL